MDMLKKYYVLPVSLSLKDLIYFLKQQKCCLNMLFIWIGNQEEMENLPKNVFCLGNIPNAGIYNKEIDLFLCLLPITEDCQWYYC